MRRMPARSTMFQPVSPDASWSRRCMARCWAKGSSRSSPALSDVAASRSPQMKSLTVMPRQPHWWRSTSVSRYSVLSCPFAVHGVVGGHDRRDALVDAALEVRQVDVVEARLVDGDVDLEAGVLHGVQCVVLGAGHHVLLRAADERGAELAEVVGLVAVGLLGASPGGMAGQVDADAAEEVAALGADLAPDGPADLFLETDVPGGAAGHRHRERGALTGDTPAGPVDELGARDPEACDGSVRGSAACCSRPA